MRFVWDERKSRSNRARHHVSFETAQLVFEDPFAMSLQDRTVEGDERWQTMGLVGAAVVLLVAHTYEEEDGEEVIRMISARKATPRERMVYAQAHKKTE
jgi:uncharacterized DUF497 family protein